MTSRLRTSIIFGTRPEAIKLAAVIRSLQTSGSVDCHVCVTAQHRDMLDQVLEAFEIRPDTDLDLMECGQGLASFTCRALAAVDKYLKWAKPDFVIVQGDTTTVIASTLAAFYNGIPVGHVEAGLRTGNLQAPWPEEANRILTTHLASLHFAPTEVSRQNLLREGIAPDKIVVTGNTAIDALLLAVDKVRMSPPVVAGLDPHVMNGTAGSTLVLITGHRRENFGPKLNSICEAILRLARQFPETHFVYPVHLNPNVRVTVENVLSSYSRNGVANLHLIDPLPYFPFVALMQRASIILTDSGGIQEEAPALGKPVLVTRETTERPEALAGGTVKLVGADADQIVAEISRLLTDKDHYSSMAQRRLPYGDGTAAKRITRAILKHFERAN